MQLWEIFFLGIALSVDAFAAGMSDAATCPRLSVSKRALIAFTFAAFQFVMPIAGYYCGAAFTSVVGRIAPYLSFALLLFLGGKSLVDWQREQTGVCRVLHKTHADIGAGKIFLQGIATSLDALAVGVTLLAQELTIGLPVSVWLCAALIGATTLTLSSVAVEAGRAAGRRFGDDAEFWGGAVLVLIGCKILFEGILP